MFVLLQADLSDFAVALREILDPPRSEIKWCDIHGEPLSFVGSAGPAHLASKVPSLADLAQLLFRHPDFFHAGSVHEQVDFWEHLIASTTFPCRQVDLLQIIREEVRIDSFFRHFKGNFKGRHYDSPEPLIFSFPNSPSCDAFSDFINATILAWVSQGVVQIHGLVGLCSA